MAAGLLLAADVAAVVVVLVVEVACKVNEQA